MKITYIARGDAFVLPARPVALPSPLQGVSPSAWGSFVRALAVQERGAETTRGLGEYAMRYLRLADVGCVRDLRRETSPDGHPAWIGDFVGTTKKEFLRNPLLQYNILVRSVVAHDAHLPDLPEGVTRSGGLAILHSAGPQALRNWTKGPRRDPVRGLVRGEILAKEAEELLRRTNRLF